MHVIFARCEIFELCLIFFLELGWLNLKSFLGKYNPPSPKLSCKNLFH